ACRRRRCRPWLPSALHPHRITRPRPACLVPKESVLTTATVSSARPPAIEQLRTRAMTAAGQGRFDEARALLESGLAQDDAPKLELMSDIAAVALRAGGLVEAIAIARHVVGKLPDHDEA